MKNPPKAKVPEKMKGAFLPPSETCKDFETDTAEWLHPWV